MALCCNNIQTTIFDAKCDITARKGGIPYIIAVNCGFTFTDVKSLSEWESALGAGMISLLPIGIGSKPETEKTKVRYDSCNPEKTSNIMHTINFRTYDADLVDNTDFAKWKEFYKNSANYLFFYVDCNDNIYANTEDNTGFAIRDFELDHIIDETNEESSYFQVILRWNYQNIVEGFSGKSILEAILSDLNS